MAFKHQTGDDFSTGGTFLREPGTYHVCVTELDENPAKRDGSLIDNAAFRVYFEVLTGTVKGQEEKTGDIIFFYPKLQSKNEGAFARKKIDRFLLSVGLVSEADKSKDLEVDLRQAIGRHFIVKLEHDDEQKFLQVAFADIFHVDDPAVKDIPKNAAAMAIGGTWRLVGAKAREPAKKSPSALATAKAQPVAAAEQWSDL
jgi:hypothetical protein